MPIYEYRCGACGHYLDSLQKISDPPLTDCPDCGEAALKRLISAPSFRLKGSGWYETDFKSEKERRRNLADGSGEGAKPESGDKKSESAKSDKSDKTDKTAGTGKQGGDSGSGSKASAAGSKGSGSEAA